MWDFCPIFLYYSYSPVKYFWDQSHVTIVWNTRETGDMYFYLFFITFCIWKRVLNLPYIDCFRTTWSDHVTITWRMLKALTNSIYVLYVMYLKKQLFIEIQSDHTLYLFSCVLFIVLPTRINLYYNTALVNWDWKS